LSDKLENKINEVKEIKMENAYTQKVAVLLAGSGAKDGSEITEAVSLLICLSLKGIPYEIFAPDRTQTEVINHRLGEPTGESRGILEEANRIARGRAKPLSSLNASEFSALVIPGGFGTAKNLCTYGRQGTNAILFPDVEETLLSFIKASKPIGVLCIAPLLVALAFKKLNLKGVQLTLGSGSAMNPISFIESLGAIHRVCGRQDSVLDTTYKVISAPAYMYDDATPADIFKCTESLVQTLHDLLHVSMA
jgi:enhancing lycopene biosynthesis protein 2